MTYPVYAEYKGSGVEWLGKVPKHWAVLSLKLLADIVLGKMLTPNDKGGMLLKPYLRARNIRWQNVDTSDINKMWFSPAELLQLRIREGDLLVSEGGEVGRTAIWQDELNECYIQNSVNRVRVSSGNPRFFLYQFYAAGHWGYFDAIVNKISIAHLTKEKLGDAKFLTVPIDEQTQIATFLDRETQKIDRLIEKQQQLIKLLQEKRQAVISHAVTKGLNPNAKMKESGVEWLGDIPAHWEMMPLKFIANIQTGIAKGKDKGNSKIVVVPYLRVANVQDGFLDLGTITTIEIPVSDLGRYLLRKGDVLMNEGGDYDKLGRGHVWNGEIEPCIHQNHVFAIRPKKVESEWINEISGSDYAQFYFKIFSKQTTNLASISSTNLMNLPVVVPPVHERKEILVFIRNQKKVFDALVFKIQKSLNLLKERRTALISAAVTGKIDVRNVA